MGEKAGELRQDPTTYGRTASFALVGLLVQVVLAVGLLVEALLSGSPALLAAGWFGFAGLPAWVIVALIYQQMRIAKLEALENEQLRGRENPDSSLFARGSDELLVGQRRLDGMLKWGLPVVSLLTMLYLAGGVVLLLVRIASPDVFEPLSRVDPAQGSAELPYDPLQYLILPSILFFLGLIVSRMMVGMAEDPARQLLRGPANLLMGTAAFSAAAVIGLVLANAGLAGTLSVLGWALPVVMGLVALEIGATLILDMYRPRQAQEVPRPAFDSRLLGLLTAPDSIARTINETINYQFGFEITRSWFWQLLGRLAVPLVAAGVVLLWLLSSVVVVEEGQQALATRFGQIGGEAMGPGLHLKAPWPIGSVRRYETDKVRSLVIDGGREAVRDGLAEAGPTEALLWGLEQTKNEPLMLVSETGGAGGGTRGVALAHVEVVIQYRIGDLRQYALAAESPEDVFAALARTQVSQLLLRTDIDALLGGRKTGEGRLARLALEDAMHQRLQAAMRARELGLEVLNVGLARVRPPADGDVAKAFHGVVSAEHRAETAVDEARRKRIEVLTRVAGSRSRAETILRTWNEYEALRGEGAADEAIAQKREQLDTLLRNAEGEVATILASARAERWARENAERGKADRFLAELQAYAAAPDVYRMSKLMDALTEGLKGARKYLIVTKQQDREIRVDLQEGAAGLGSVLDLGEEE